MSRVVANGVDFHVEIEGEGDTVVVLHHSLMTTADAWAPLIDRLKDRFRFLAYDIRGHGRSSAPAAPYSIADLGDDVLALMDAHGVEKAHFVGLSIGGRVGMHLAANHPERFGKVVLACASPNTPAAAVPDWESRIATTHAKGTSALVTGTIERWYGPTLGEYPVVQLDALAAMIAATSVPGFEGCARALMGYDATPDLPRIAAPTLVIAGAHDAGASPETAMGMVTAIPDSRLVVIEGAGHQACLQQPNAFATAVREFLGGQMR